MSVLSNTSKGAFRDLKAAILVHLQNTPGAGKSWERIRYADNLNQWLELAAVETVGGVDALRVAFCYLSGFTSIWSEARQRKITATFSIEVIHGFADGTDVDNSTLSYEDFIGDLADAFSTDTALGFTDAASQDVYNSPLSVPEGENEGKPVYVDGVLAHRATCSLTIEFRLC